MGDHHLMMQFDIDAPASAVLAWLDSPAAIAGWWSDTVEGEASHVGDTFRVSFPTTPVVFELEVTACSDERVEWHVPESPPWWEGTTIRFDLEEGDEGGTRLQFSHRDFDADNPVIPVITPAWVRFLDNLVEVVRSGEPRPAVVNR